MATKGCDWLLPLPRNPGQYRSVECLRATLAAIVAPHFAPPQPALGRLGSHDANPRAMDSRSTRFTSLSYWSASSPIIQGRSRMRKRACTDLCGGQSVRVVPTASRATGFCWNQVLVFVQKPRERSSGFHRCSTSKLLKLAWVSADTVNPTYPSVNLLSCAAPTCRPSTKIVISSPISCTASCASVCDT